MSSTNLIFTVVYPQALKFFKDFCTSALNQSFNDFEVLVVNDGCDNNTLFNLLAGLNYTIIDAIGSPAENRQQGINYAFNKMYKYLIFCDADDTFSPERIGDTVRLLNITEYDILVCNLNIVDESLHTLIKDYFSLEIPGDKPIDKEFIRDKNIFGMSNTAIKLQSLKEDISIPDTPIVDWYLFTMLLNKGLKAGYINQSYVNYRQYDANMIGINCFDVPTFKRLANYKYCHYKILVEKGFPDYKSLLYESEKLLTVQDKGIETIISKQLEKHRQPLWWQVINNQ